MIKISSNIFSLETNSTSYIFGYTKSGLLIHYYYGAKIPIYDYRFLEEKVDGGMGTACLYEGNPNEWVDNINMECSFFGKGDYREVMINLYSENLGFMNNFKYQNFTLLDKLPSFLELPYSYDPDQILRLDLYDERFLVRLELYYQVYEKANVISRFIRIVNESNNCYLIKRALSAQLDFFGNDFLLETFDGAWAKERHQNQKALTMGIYINDSKCGASSNKHNPFILLKKKTTSEDSGLAYGFNLVYSGNHASIIEVTPTKKTRVLMGINPFSFEYRLPAKDSFLCPEVVMSFSAKGLNKLSQNMHYFVNNHIVRGMYKNKERPILLNSWEGAYFNFDEKTILKMAKRAKDLGIELFVLDDGWFGKRNNDTSSLGDWFVNLHKIPSGLKALSAKIKALGLKFGLWFEPEMLSPNSEYFKNNPEHSVKVDDNYSLGRHQLHLDLTNLEVREYLKKTLENLFIEAELDYVKWDYNRNLTELYGISLASQGEFYHRYILGLYEVLSFLTSKFPHILFESCASGGNRFDLGMLCFMPQIWTSDNTDYLERLYIQNGTSYAYPLSVMGAHVSSVPNHQTLRISPLASRFNVSCFGLLGYELDVSTLSSKDEEEIKKQIIFYKKNRALFQFGTFYRGNKKLSEDSLYWYVINEDEGILGFFQKLIHPSMLEDIIYLKGLESKKLYSVTSVKTKVDLKAFGSLIKLVVPFRIKVDGKIHNLICQLYKPNNGYEEYLIYGKALALAGLRLNQQFMGTGFNNKVRVLGDFGSQLYLIKKITKTKYYLHKRKV